MTITGWVVFIIFSVVIFSAGIMFAYIAESPAGKCISVIISIVLTMVLTIIWNLLQ